MTVKGKPQMSLETTVITHEFIIFFKNIQASISPLRRNN